MEPKGKEFNVKDYGATPGDDDCREAIQRAIDAAAAEGGESVHFPNGPYLIGGDAAPENGVGLQEDNRQSPDTSDTESEK